VFICDHSLPGFRKSHNVEGAHGMFKQLEEEPANLGLLLLSEIKPGMPTLARMMGEFACTVTGLHIRTRIRVRLHP
jgi:hypothetical protein